jgi:hypothetical protein
VIWTTSIPLTTRPQRCDLKNAKRDVAVTRQTSAIAVSQNDLQDYLAATLSGGSTKP